MQEDSSQKIYEEVEELFEDLSEQSLQAIEVNPSIISKPKLNNNIEEEIKQDDLFASLKQSTTKNDDAELLKEYEKKFGQFRSKMDINSEIDRFTEVHSITRWDLLMHRYKPQYMP
jgi:aminopeptidase N